MLKEPTELGQAGIDREVGVTGRQFVEGFDGFLLHGQGKNAGDDAKRTGGFVDPPRPDFDPVVPQVADPVRRVWAEIQGSREEIRTIVATGGGPGRPDDPGKRAAAAGEKVAALREDNNRLLRQLVEQGNQPATIGAV